MNASACLKQFSLTGTPVCVDQCFLSSCGTLQWEAEQKQQKPVVEGGGFSKQLVEGSNIITC